MAINESLTLTLALKIEQWTKGLVDAAGKTKAFETEIQGATDKTKKLRDEMGRFTKDADKAFDKGAKKAKAFDGALKEASATVDDLKGNIVALGAAIGGSAFFGDAVTKAREFDAAMREVVTIVPEGTAKLAELSSQVQKVSLEMGVEGPRAAKALYQAISSGVDAEKAQTFMKEAAVLAKGGVAELEDSVDLLTSVINTFGLDVSNTQAISDSFEKATELGKITITEFNQIIGRTAPISAAAGISLVEMEAALAALTASGLKAGQAGTNYQQLIQSIIKPSEEARGVAESLGLSFDTLTLRTKGLKGFLDEVGKATKGNTDVIAQLFPSVEALNAALILSGTGAKAFATDLNAIGQAGGSAANAAKIIGDGFDDQFKRISVAVEQGQASLGKFLVEIVSGTSLTADNVGVVQLKIKAFFKQIEVGVGFIITNVFQRAILGIKDIGLEIVNAGTLAKEIFTEGPKRALDNFRISENRREAAMRRGIADIERGNQAVKRSAQESAALYIEAETLSAKIAANAEKQAKSQKDITGQLKTQTDLEKESLAIREKQQQDADAQQFGNRSQDFLRSALQRIGDLQSQGLATSRAQGLIDYVQKQLEKATSAADLGELGIRLQQKLDDEITKIAERDGKIEEAFEREAENIGRQASRTIGNSVVRGIEGSAEVIEEAARFSFQRIGNILDGSISGIVSSRSLTTPFEISQALRDQKEQDRIRNQGFGFSAAAGLRPGDLLSRNLFFAQGGMVPGPNTMKDSVPAQLTPGEFVINRDATRAFLPLLQAINREGKPSPSVNVNLGGVSVAGSGLTNDVIDSQIIPRIRFLMRMNRLG